MAGGFIWDFVDQALKVERDGQVQYLYGGDFDEEKSHRYFCANGIVNADRQLQPSIVQVKKGYQAIEIKRDKHHFIIKNKYSFLNLNQFDLSVRLLIDGQLSQEKTICLDLAALKTRSLAVPFEYKLDQGEYIVEFALLTKQDEIWAQKGYEIAFEQFILQEAQSLPRLGRKIDYTIGEETITFKDGHIDLSNGDLTYFKLSPMRLNLWRAKTDNDRGIGNFSKTFEKLFLSNHWQKASESYKLKNYNMIEKNDHLQIVIDQEVKHFESFTRTYMITDQGVDVNIKCLPKKEMDRLGVTFEIPRAWQDFTWYGRGPEENYLDRKTGSKIGVHSKNVLDYRHDYMRPQENSNRSDIRWFNICNQLKITDLTLKGLSISAWNYSQEDLETSEHIHELVSRDLITLNIDHRQKGVGGDEPGVAALHEPYKLHAKVNYQYQFRIQRIENEQTRTK